MIFFVNKITSYMSLLILSSDIVLEPSDFCGFVDNATAKDDVVITLPGPQHVSGRTATFASVTAFKLTIDSGDDARILHNGRQYRQVLVPRFGAIDVSSSDEKSWSIVVHQPLDVC